MSDRQGKNVLFVYFTFSQQTGRAVDAMADAASKGGATVTKARIELADGHYSRRFAAMPMRFPILKIIATLPAQLRRKTAEITIPSEAEQGVYDLVVIGSPTWWLTTNIAIRSYLKSEAAATVLAGGTPFAGASVSRKFWRGNIKTIHRLGEHNGGRWIDETHFTAAGGQVKSMMAWVCFMFFGESRERFLGIKLPPPNLQPDFPEQATRFIGSVVDRLDPTGDGPI